MCYTGTGRLEGYMGGCNVCGNYKAFKERYGYEACLVCLGGDCPETAEEFKEENKPGGKFDKIAATFIEEQTRKYEKGKVQQ